MRAWWLLAGLMIAAFLARGPLYLSVLPPFEGWDEYQHLAYIVHLDETGSIPVFNKSNVSATLRPLIAAMPHSQWGGEQVQEWGALPYAEFWNAPARASDGERRVLRLYQAQQPPLAYVVDLPIWRALNEADPLAAIAAIRIVNLLFVAAALVLFAAALERLVPAFAPRVAVLALVCLHPLFFQNLARVANDGLAVATGIAGISLLLVADGRTLLTRGLLAAVCLAASVWAKQTSLTLVPAFALGVPLIGWAHGLSAGRLWRVTSIVGVAFLLLVGPMWLWSYQHYGAILTTQDSIEIAQKGSVVTALITSARTLAWGPVIDFLLVPGRAWVGGWSFLEAQQPLANLYRWSWPLLLLTAAIGAVIALLRRARKGERTVATLRTDRVTTAGLVVCAMVVVFTALGMLYHAVQGNAVYGRSFTNPWYFMTAQPFLFVLVVRGLEAIHRWLATAAAAALAVLFVAIDLHGTWVRMPAHYASTTNPVLQWSRLSAIHPAMLSGNLRWVFLALQLGALCLVVGGLVYAWRSTRGVRLLDHRSLGGG